MPDNFKEPDVASIQLMTILDSVPSAVLIIRGSDRQVTFANRHARAIYGIGAIGVSPGDRLEGLSFFRIDGTPLPLAEAPVSRTLATGEAVEDEEVVVRRTSGQSRTFLISSAPLREADGTVTAAVVSFLDITERKQTELALQESETRYRELVKHAPAAIYEIDYQQRRFVSVNDAMSHITGYSRDELLAMNPMSLLEPDSQQRLQANIDHVMAGGLPSAVIDYRVRTKDGRTIYVALNRSFKFDEQGRPTRATIIAHDITERRLMEERLREKELLLRTIVRNAPDILFIKDRDSRVLLINDAYCTVFGVESDSVVGRTDFEIYSDPAVARHNVDNDRLVMETGQTQVFEESADTPDGRATFLISKSPWLDENGQVIGIVGSGVDITERKRLEEQLHRKAHDLAVADRNKNHFLNMLSHELRNPLAAIVSSIDLLTYENGNRDSTSRILSVLKRQSGHLTRLVDDLLDVTRISTNKMRLRKERVDLNEIMRRTIADNQSQTARSGVEVSVELPAEPVRLHADPVRLAQLIGNLLHNAIKFTPAGGRVTLTLSRDEAANEARIVVEDSGSGIAPDVLPALFEPFSQAEQSLARSGGGLGLGLSIVKGITELHGGRVEAHSDGIGQGARFTVTLPLSPPAGPQSATSTHP